jgi:hypothetical protein
MRQTSLGGRTLKSVRSAECGVQCLVWSDECEVRSAVIKPRNFFGSAGALPSKKPFAAVLGLA